MFNIHWTLKCSRRVHQWTHTNIVNLPLKRCKGNSIGKGQSFQQMIPEQLDVNMQKREWRRKWQPTPVFLPGEFMDAGACELQSMESQRVRHNLATKWWRCKTKQSKKHPLYILYTKIHSKWFIVCKCNCKFMKFLIENTAENLYNIGLVAKSSLIQ